MPIRSVNEVLRSKPDYYLKEFVKLIECSFPSKNLQDVFFDFLELATISMANIIPKSEELEKRFFNIMAGYTSEEAERFPEMLSLLVLHAERHPMQDIFCDFFNAMGFQNKHNGQFFTPTAVADLSAAIVFNDIEKNDIASRNFITFMEPTCGSGTMIMAYARKCQKEGINPQQKLLVTATDLDFRCVCMAFLNLALNGIPAIVIHGNSITLETFEKLYTPFYWTTDMPFRTALKTLLGA